MCILAAMSTPTIGRIVHYVLPSGPSKGQIRPAIITSVAPGLETIGLHVFVDGANDGEDASLHNSSATRLGDEKTHGTWFWPQRATDDQLNKPAVKPTPVAQTSAAKTQKPAADELPAEAEVEEKTPSHR